MNKFDKLMIVLIGSLFLGTGCFHLGNTKGYDRGYSYGRFLEKQLPQEIHLMCFNGTTWDRCRQKDGKFLTASGTEAEQVQFYFDYIQKATKP
jgi:hypothetical protein